MNVFCKIKSKEVVFGVHKTTMLLIILFEPFLGGESYKIAESVNGTGWKMQFPLGGGGFLGLCVE